MKTYLEFSTTGEITECTTKEKNFNKENYSDFKYIERIIYNKYNFILLFNTFEDNNSIKNITVLPFYIKDLYGKFLLFSTLVTNVTEVIHLKSLTEIKFLKLINIRDEPIEDYSSDDFNLSD
jgi:hypothetical protein